MRRSLHRSSIVVLGLLGTLTLGPAASALAQPATHASCLGFEAASVSPPGSSDEVPGGMAEFGAFIREAFSYLAPGVVYSSIAHLHLGSHEACDEAIG
jgi:hypothetical protein